MSPVPEPASALLRKLDREATAGPWALDTREPLDFVLWGPAGEAVGNIGGLCVPVLTDDDVAADPEIRRIVEAERCDITLIANLRNALPALADLVEETETIDGGTCNWQPMHEKGKHPGCPPCVAHRALAALRERLGVKP